MPCACCWKDRVAGMWVLWVLDLVASAPGTDSHLNESTCGQVDVGKTLSLSHCAVLRCANNRLWPFKHFHLKHCGHVAKCHGRRCINNAYAREDIWPHADVDLSRKHIPLIDLKATVLDRSNCNQMGRNLDIFNDAQRAIHGADHHGSSMTDPCSHSPQRTHAHARRSMCASRTSTHVHVLTHEYSPMSMESRAMFVFKAYMYIAICQLPQSPRV
eukprot:jgi/Botrbrau1/19642/Bobra.0003s0012.1